MTLLSNALTTAWTVLIPLAEKAPDPDDVKPGWLGFGVFLLLAAALGLLIFSFRKQLRKVDFEERNGNSNGAPGSDGPKPSA